MFFFYVHIHQVFFFQVHAIQEPKQKYFILFQGKQNLNFKLTFKLYVLSQQYTAHRMTKSMGGHAILGG